jgi:PAS domain S-box-containing protein
VGEAGRNGRFRRLPAGHRGPTHRRRRGPFEPQILEALRAVADIIALSIERQRADDERERYRVEAQAQRDFLARVFRQAPAAVAVLRGPEHVYEIANAPYLALTGDRQILGMKVRDAFPEFAGQGLFELLDGVYTTSERVLGSELFAQFTRGGALTEGYFNFVFEPMRDASGATEGIVIVAVEVTDQVLARKSAEGFAEGLAAQQAALRASEERFRSLVTATSQIVWTAAPDGAKNADSPTWRAFTGKAFDEWSGMRWLDQVHPDDRTAVVAAWRRAAAEGDHYKLEYKLRRRDGVYRTMLARGVPVRNDDGSLREWIGTCSDVTEERIAVQHLEFLARSGEALAASLDYDVTLRAAAQMVVPALADMCVVDVMENDAEFRRVEVVHADPSLAEVAQELRVYPPSTDVDHPIAKAFASGQMALLEEVDDEVLERIARSPRHLELLREMNVASAIFLPLSTHGQLKGVLSLFTTESSHRTFGEAELAVASEVGRRVSMALDNALLFAAAQSERDRAEQANRAKDEFLAMMSHELRTPLNAMLGWTRMLRAGTLTEEKKTRALETIERNAKAQAQLVDDVLDVSRIITGKLRLNVVSVNLLEAVETAIESVKPAAEAKGIRLQALLDPDAGTIMGDPDRFQQICWNLLTNAVKFTPKGGRVHVRLQREDSHVHVAIEDNGKGIPPEFLPYVFERFRQADASITRAHGGLGLGLAIVKHLVELHGGTIEAKSEGNDQGAQFIVRVPISPLRAVSLAPAVAARPVVQGEAFECPPGVAGLNILVLDDEGDARELLETVITGCDAHVHTAATVADALAALRERTFDVIVSDIGMPNQDGYAFIRAVRELGADKGGRTPAVALTAYARSEDRTRALLAGFNSHVAKPVEPMELLVVIANLAGRFGTS